MEMLSIVLSTSAITFKGTCILGYIAKIKPTATSYAVMSLELVGSSPSHLKIPHNLEGSVSNYDNIHQLINILAELLEKSKLLNNSRVQVKEVKTELPFLLLN